MPSHRVNPPEPHIVMHEDDPVLTKRWNRITQHLTRQNVKRVAWIFGVITLALLLFNQAVVIALYNGLQNERQARIQGTDDAICSLIDLVPPGNIKIDAVRDRYKCGPFIPGPGDPTSIATPNDPGSAPSASTPSSTTRTTVTKTGTVTTTATTKVQSTLTSIIPGTTITKTTVNGGAGSTVTRTATTIITLPSFITSTQTVTVTITVPTVVCTLLAPLC